ncbi:MAG: ribosomal RNA small subunit methyltransferase G [Candidatus Hepatoplasma vulgare]|nr:MAG: ribosomal RNA small subunit methyltransferase G [Candidatus Hepatoplasma sp.]
MYSEKYLKDFCLSKKQYEDLDSFYIEFRKGNKVVNLSSNVSEEDFFIKNIKDSLGITKFIEFKKGENIIDVGTGGGFPGLVLAIIFPEVNFTLIDSNRKKINWVNIIKNKFFLKNVEIIWGRIETQKQLLAKFDYVIFRAFSQTGINTEIGSFLLKPEGSMILYKGKNYKEELKGYNEEEIIFKFDVKLDEIFDWDLEENLKRYFVIFKKLGWKNSSLPRRHNQILSKPYF